ncbi:MAG: hypothetical protein SGI92_10855 [Bryobacteraceae bacterium]|nr:hypothetical protein [Bryobacteraceae bacterium]
MIVEFTVFMVSDIFTVSLRPTLRARRPSLPQAEGGTSGLAQQDVVDLVHTYGHYETARIHVSAKSACVF